MNTKTKWRLASLSRSARTLAARVERGLDAAESHALNGLSGGLVALPDGRKSVAAVARSRALASATDRLRECQADILSAIADFRADSYRREFAAWKTMIPRSAWRSADPEPTAAALDSVRGMVIHGMTLRDYVSGLFDRAIRTLAPTMVAASRRDYGRSVGSDLIKAWSKIQSRQIMAAIRGQLVSSQTEADIRAGRDLIRPELLTPEAREHGG